MDIAPKDPDESVIKTPIRCLYGMSKARRYFATRILLFTDWYNLYFFTCVNSMKSHCVSPRLGHVLKNTTLASIHMTARRRG